MYLKTYTKRFAQRATNAYTKEMYSMSKKRFQNLFKMLKNAFKNTHKEHSFFQNAKKCFQNAQIAKITHDG